MPASVLVLGAGYIGAAVAELALARGRSVVLADNWNATERGRLDALERRGAVVETADTVSYTHLTLPTTPYV